MIKAIIFDQDGVLINSEPLHFNCWKVIFAQEGIQITYDVFKECIGSTQPFLFELIRKNYGMTIDRPKEMAERMLEEKNRQISENGYPRIPGVEILVRDLKKEGFLLAVASSSPMKHICQAVEKLGINDCFDRLVSGETVAHPKPAPDTFLLAAEKLGVDPSECMVIEDSTNGGLAAKAAGMKCIWFHNPDSGDQSIPHALLTVTDWGEASRKRVTDLLQELT